MSRPDREVEYWNDPTVAADLRAGTSGVSSFAKEVEARLSGHATVLELGCGAGDDAAYFAQQGHYVTALDVSGPLVDVAAQRFANLRNLEFRRANITRPLDVGAQSCDAVFSHLSLHYFDDGTTAGVLSEVLWVLRQGGYFYFLCKSTEDPLYGKGTELAPDMYELGGHVRHFFSPEYAREILEDVGFINIEVTSGKDKFYGEQSAYVKCAGMKP